MFLGTVIRGDVKTLLKIFFIIIFMCGLQSTTYASDSDHSNDVITDDCEFDDEVIVEGAKTDFKRQKSHKSYYESLPNHTIDVVIVLATTMLFGLGWSPDFIQLVLGYYLADLVAGIIHFTEDSCDNILPRNSVICPNRNHHLDPLEIKEHSPLNVVSSSALAVSPFLAGAYLTGMPEFIYYTLFFAGISNWIHQMAHHSPREVKKYSWIVWALQKAGVMQSHKHHKKHHYSLKRDTHYCVNSNALNWLLQQAKFWDFMRWAYSKAGIKLKEISDEESYRSNCSQVDENLWPKKIDRGMKALLRSANGGEN